MNPSNVNISVIARQHNRKFLEMQDIRLISPVVKLMGETLPVIEKLCSAIQKSDSSISDIKDASNKALLAIVLVARLANKTCDAKFNLETTKENAINASKQTSDIKDNMGELQKIIYRLTLHTDPKIKEDIKTRSTKIYEAAMANKMKWEESVIISWHDVQGGRRKHKRTRRNRKHKQRTHRR